jgi:hypothetical protein
MRITASWSGCDAWQRPIVLLIAFGSAIPQSAEWQRIGNQIDAAMIFAGSNFVKRIVS